MKKIIIGMLILLCVVGFVMAAEVEEGPGAGGVGGPVPVQIDEEPQEVPGAGGVEW